MKILYSSPGLEDLWQMHFSLLSGQEYTVPGMFIANVVDEQPAAMPVAPMPPPPPGPGAPPPPVHNGPAHWIKVSAQQDGIVHGHERPQRLQQDLQGRDVDQSPVLFAPCS